MLEPNLATMILLGVCILLLVVIPMLDGSTRFAKYISLRYTLVSVTLIMALGCILDFSHLADQSRNIVLLGGIILVGIFVIVRSFEKMKLGNKVIEISAEHKGTKVGAKLQNKDDPKQDNKSEEKDKKEESDKSEESEEKDK